jgi:hypothetical protein
MGGLVSEKEKRPGMVFVRHPRSPLFSALNKLSRLRLTLDCLCVLLYLLSDQVTHACAPLEEPGENRHKKMGITIP